MLSSGERFRYDLVLAAMVVLIAAFIGLYWVEALRTVATDVGSDSDGRNERSTPKSFILPATPAVALEQELRLREPSERVALEKCSARLNVMGYDVGDELVSFNAKLVEATYLFQRGHGLAATGRLNQATKSALRC